jgi:hypothetical protein
MGEQVSAAAVGVRPIRVCVIVLPELLGANPQALENRLRIDCSRAGRFCIAVHFCGKGQPSFLRAKLLRSDEAWLYSAVLDSIQLVPADILRRLLGDREI